MPAVKIDEEEIQIELENIPASVQSKKSRREQTQAEVAEITNEIPFLFSGDVQVQIQLRLSEQERYETDKSADIDNVIKPLLDGLIGPKGVMIDDNQVQSVQCYWIQHLKSPSALVTIRNPAREYVSKEKLFFVHMGNQMYFPVQGYLSNEIIFGMLGMLETYRQARNKLEGAGIDYHSIRYATPMQRYFHRTRISAFDRIEYDEAILKYQPSNLSL